MDDLPDYRTASPDAGHEAIRVPLAQAIDDLTEHAQRLDDAFLMLLATTGAFQATLTAVLGGQAAMAALEATAETISTRLETALADMRALQQQVGDLGNRIAALEGNLSV